MPNTAATSADRSDPRIEREARRILRRLCEKGAFLAVAPEMERAVVLREVVPGKQNRIAVVDRDVAYAFALQEWIACEKAGKIACYAITAVGRAALKRLLTEERNDRGPRDGFAEAQTPFQEQHRFFAERTVMAEDGSGARKLRFNLAESPLSVLGPQARQGRGGLSRPRAHRGRRAAARGLRAGADRSARHPELGALPDRRQRPRRQPRAAGRRKGRRTRGSGSPSAMEALGPGLSDIVFRICCFLEGLETAEKRLGWSARSGKVVLKIALERLAAHYGITRTEVRRAG